MGGFLRGSGDNNHLERGHHNLRHGLLLLPILILLALTLILITRRQQSSKHIPTSKPRARRGRWRPPLLPNLLRLNRRPRPIRRTVGAQPRPRSRDSRFRRRRCGLGLHRGRGRGREARIGGCWGWRRELLLVFLDDWEYDFFMCVVGLDHFHAVPMISSQHGDGPGVQNGYDSPLHIAASFILLATLSSYENTQNRPSESPIPLSSLRRSPENQEGSRSASDRNPPLELDSKPRVRSTSDPNRSRDLVDPSEIGVDDAPTGPNHRASGGLRNQITGGDHRR